MNRVTAAPRNRLLLGDARDHLRKLPAASLDMVATSPPYFRLRNYGEASQLGLERSVDDWVDGLAAVAAEIARALTPTGTFWLNLGDTYANRPADGAAPKSLLLGPERLALRLQRDGWIIRNKIVWAKPNPVPTSVRDRLNCTYEVIYVLARQRVYFFDLDAVRQPHRSRAGRRGAGPKTSQKPEGWRGPNGMTAAGLASVRAAGRVGHPLGKNPGDVWTIAPGGYRSAHHATFPLALAQRMIAAGCPERRCTNCRLPWRRSVIRALGAAATRSALAASCDCRADTEPGLVCDPFMGSGTTAVAAEKLQRDWLGIELSPTFAALARRRIAAARAGTPSATRTAHPPTPPDATSEGAAA